MAAPAAMHELATQPVSHGSPLENGLLRGHGLFSYPTYAQRGLRPQPKTEYLAQRAQRTQREATLYLSFSATFAPSA